jgi:ketosteroid isomerase-like protein
VDAGDRPDARDAFEAALGAHAALLRKEGAGAACRARSSNELRLYRDGAPPILGRRAACRALDASGEHALVHRAGTGISDSRDLAYDYGTVDVIGTDDPGPSRRASYLGIWKTDDDGAWRLVLDIWSPHPPAESGEGD